MASSNVVDEVVDTSIKARIVSWGKRLEWVDDVSKMICTRCGAVLLYHFVASCGHKFCHECKRKLPREFACPHVECAGTRSYMPENDFDGKPMKMRGHCINYRPYGCSAVAPFYILVYHMKHCRSASEDSTEKEKAEDGEVKESPDDFHFLWMGVKEHEEALVSLKAQLEARETQLEAKEAECQALKAEMARKEDPERAEQRRMLETAIMRSVDLQVAAKELHEQLMKTRFPKGISSPRSPLQTDNDEEFHPFPSKARRSLDLGEADSID